MAAGGCCCVECINTSEVGIVERFGRFSKFAQPGPNVLLCPCEYMAGRVSTRVQQLDVNCETKTLDNVFVTVLVSVQYLVVKEKIYAAFYKLTNPVSQIQAYVFDVIRATVPTMTLDEAFESKEVVAAALKTALSQTMAEYGFQIAQALVTDLSPDPKVKAAMNEITAQRNWKNAAKEKAEGEKILLVKTPRPSTSPASAWRASARRSLTVSATRSRTSRATSRARRRRMSSTCCC